MRGAVEGGRHVLLLRPEIPHFDEICRTYPQGAGDPHRIQHPRTFDEPRQPEDAALGCV